MHLAKKIADDAGESKQLWFGRRVAFIPSTMPPAGYLDQARRHSPVVPVQLFSLPAMGSC